jgi:hypothetical protein
MYLRTQARRLARKLFHFLVSWKKWRQFVSEFKSFKAMLQQNERGLSLNWIDRHPILDEKTIATPFDSHYIYHPAWAARIIAQNKPALHVDISSILHFSTLLSATTPVEFYDYRPVHLTLDNLTCKSADLTCLPFHDNSLHSLSCMHVVEHIGLGRYGDPLDPDGDLKAIRELKRVLAIGGSLLFVTPVGRPKIRFNAHRIYSYDQVMEYFTGLTLKQFALVDDKKQFTLNANPALADQQNYGCGCWWYIK